MPRDKSETNAKIIECMREEFLNFGYEKASLNRVRQRVRHDMSKEDAREHMRFVCRLLYPGWKELLGIKE